MNTQDLPGCPFCGARLLPHPLSSALWFHPLDDVIDGERYCILAMLLVGEGFHSITAWETRAPQPGAEFNRGIARD